MTLKEQIEQVRLQDIMPELRKNGIVKLYSQHKSQIDDIAAGFFHNAQGIHGVAHAKRVLFLSLILSYYNRLAENDRNLLILAAIYHDIGRTNDWKCEVHGRESVKRLENAGLCDHLALEDKTILYFLIEYHCINDAEALKKLMQSSIKNKARAEKLFYIFKDSDALDRCRIADLDITYLRNNYSFKLAQLAWDLLEGGISAL